MITFTGAVKRVADPRMTYADQRLLRQVLESFATAIANRPAAIASAEVSTAFLSALTPQQTGSTELHGFRATNGRKTMCSTT